MKRLYEVMEEHFQNPKYPLHMPGNKRRFTNFGYEAYDFTEIHGLDNLQNPEECIKETCLSISKAFKADESLILINGSTSGLLASILGTISPNETVLIGRNCHQSVLNGVYLAKCNHSFIFPNISEEGLVTDFSLEEIENHFKTDSSIKTLVVTSPTYEGVVLDIKSILGLTKKYGVTLVVDEAHGAYFIDKNLPQSAVELGADVVIQSLHKTLPCPTQTALLHLNKCCIHNESIKRHLSMVQTTSPSYFFMYVIDKFIQSFENHLLDEAFDKHFKRITNFRNNCEKLKSYGVIELVCKDFKNKYNIFNLDIYKLVFIAKKGNGLEIVDILRNKYNIEMEMANNGYFIGMTSIADSDEIFEQFFEALLEISKVFENKVTYTSQKIIFPRKDVIKKLCDINISNTISLNINDPVCVGKLCATNITPYPPCVPYLVAGEVIEKEDLLAIKTMVASGVSILGVDVVDGEVFIKVI